MKMKSNDIKTSFIMLSIRGNFKGLRHKPKYLILNNFQDDWVKKY